MTPRQILLLTVVCLFAGPVFLAAQLTPDPDLDHRDTRLEIQLVGQGLISQSGEPTYEPGDLSGPDVLPFQVFQHGQGHLTTARVQGTDNTALLDQSGHENSIRLQLHGNRNRIRAIQSGCELDVLVHFAYADDLRLEILQSGKDNQVHLDFGDEPLSPADQALLPTRIEQKGHGAPDVILNPSTLHAIPVRVQ